MRFSMIRRIVLPGKDGKMKWVEMSEKFMPPGGKKFTLAYGTFGSLIAFIGFVWYVAVQNEYNPDSVYGRLYRRFTDFSYLTDNFGHKTQTEAYAGQDRAKLF